MHRFLYISLFVVAVAHCAVLSFSGQLADVGCGKQSVGSCATPPQFSQAAADMGMSETCTAGSDPANWVSIDVPLANAGWYYVSVHATKQLNDIINVGIYANGAFSCGSPCDNLVWALRGKKTNTNPTTTTVGAVYLPAGDHKAIITHQTTGVDLKAGVFVIEVTPSTPPMVSYSYDGNSTERSFLSCAIAGVPSTTFTWTPSNTANYTIEYSGAMSGSKTSVGIFSTFTKSAFVSHSVAIYSNYKPNCTCPAMDDCGDKVTGTGLAMNVFALESGTEYTFVITVTGQTEIMAGVFFKEFVPVVFPPVAPVAPVEPMCFNQFRLGDTDWTRPETTGNVTTTCTAGNSGKWNAVPVDTSSTGYYIWTPTVTTALSPCEMIDDVVLALYNASVAPDAFSMRDFQQTPPDCAANQLVQAGTQVQLSDWVIANSARTIVATAADQAQAIENAVFGFNTVSGQPVGCFPEIPPTEAPTEAAVPVAPAATNAPTTGNNPTTGPATGPSTGNNSPASIRVIALAVILALIALLL